MWPTQRCFWRPMSRVFTRAAFSIRTVVVCCRQRFKHHVRVQGMTYPEPDSYFAACCSANSSAWQKPVFPGLKRNARR